MRPSCGWWWGPNEEGHKRAISRRSQHHVLLLLQQLHMMASVIESNRDANWIKGLPQKGTFAALSLLPTTKSKWSKSVRFTEVTMANDCLKLYSIYGES